MFVKMPRISKLTPNRKNRKSHSNSCNFLRFLVIVLSFISLLSRIIYSTYATWLTITTFDCIPCANISAINTTSDLFVSHHSSAIFKTIRGLNIKSEIESQTHSRDKRSDELKDWINLSQFMDNYSQFFSSNDYIDVKHRAEIIAKEALKSLEIDLMIATNETDFDSNATKNPSDSIKEVINQLLLNYSKNNENQNQTEFQNQIPLFFGDVTQNQIQLKDRIEDNSSLFFSSVVNELPSVEANVSNKTSIESFNYIPSNDLIQLIESIVDEKNGSDGSADQLSDSFEWTDWSTNSSNETNNSDNDMTLTIELNNKVDKSEQQMLNTSEETRDNSTLVSDQRTHQKRLLNDPQMVNDSSYISSDNDPTRAQMPVCSEECAQFLNVELSDPSIRRWATIVITGVLYLYAFVMFCILIGSCLELVDLLVVSTFIEGAKLFAGFILIIIDSFNGKQVHFNLIDVKFNVNHRGNGWTADFSYSEYLLDIIIFFLSTYLCIRVFKCFKKRPIKVSIEEMADTRGTYRSNHSRNSLAPIYEDN